MKTKTFLLLCLFLGIGLTQLSAQNGKNGIGSVSSYYEWAPDYCVPIFNSIGTQIDLLWQGTVYFHHIGHFINENLVWGKCQGFGEAVSKNTGEVFRIQEIDICNLTIIMGTCHVNLIGNQGSHYIETFIVDPFTGELTFVSAISVGKNK